MVKLQQVKNRYFLTIPLEKIKRGKLEKGQEFDIDITQEGNLILVKLKNNSVE